MTEQSPVPPSPWAATLLALALATASVPAAASQEVQTTEKVRYNGGEIAVPIRETRHTVGVVDVEVGDVPSVVLTMDDHMVRYEAAVAYADKACKARWTEDFRAEYVRPVQNGSMAGMRFYCRPRNS